MNDDVACQIWLLEYDRARLRGENREDATAIAWAVIANDQINGEEQPSRANAWKAYKFCG